MIVGWEKQAEEELQELRNRINKLEQFIRTERTSIEPDQLNLMESQLTHMKMYASILHRRIKG